MKRLLHPINSTEEDAWNRLRVHVPRGGGDLCRFERRI